MGVKLPSDAKRRKHKHPSETRTARRYRAEVNRPEGELRLAARARAKLGVLNLPSEERAAVLAELGYKYVGEPQRTTEERHARAVDLCEDALAQWAHINYRRAKHETAEQYAQRLRHMRPHIIGALRGGLMGDEPAFGAVDDSVMAALLDEAIERRTSTETAATKLYALLGARAGVVVPSHTQLHQARAKH